MTRAVATDVILQDVRNTAVQIRVADSDQCVGSGVVVSRKGLVLTCAHVVEQAGLDVRSGHHTRVDVYFPGRTTGPVPLTASQRGAWVVAVPPETEDDLVCLQVEGPLPLPAARVAILGDAGRSRGHRFSAFGFRQLDKYTGGLLATGDILGQVPAPPGKLLECEPVQLRSSEIDAGMSGSPVLDENRNLVVGVVSEAWIADRTARDRDTAWAVDPEALRLSPVAVDLHGDSLARARAVPPLLRPDVAEDAVPPTADRVGNAPLPLDEWVGRDTAVARLDGAWQDGECLVAALVGFGGEGKSSLARHWMDRRPDRGGAGGSGLVFWWSFTERASADDFLEAALDFVSGGRVPADRFADSRARAEAVGSLLDRQPCLFVLDGMEVMQEQRGDDYGTLVSPDLRDFLTFFATPGHSSFCLITTRAPVFDLTRFVTYRHIDVGSLPEASGVALLERLGVHGSSSALGQVVRDWDGHALTLSMIGAYLTRRFQGDVRRMAALPPPDPTLSRDEKVRRLLREYDACLSDAEREVLIRFSVLRTPVETAVFESLLVGEAGDAQSVRRALAHLTAARVVRTEVSGRSRVHPLVRDYYQGRTAADDARRALHRAALDYYLSVAGPAPEPGSVSTLDPLLPVVEAVHHACLAGAHEQACGLIHDRLYEGARGLITRELNAYETVLSCFTDLFPGGELRREPLVDARDSRGWVLHEVATCLQLLGRLSESAAVMRRAVRAHLAVGHWHEAAVSCQNQAELHLGLGSLPQAEAIVAEAYRLAERAGDREDVLVAATLAGTLEHYQGRNAQAAASFASALDIARESTPVPALYSTSGLRYADHLRAVGNADEASRVHTINLGICRTARWTADAAACLIGLGDLALDREETETARELFDEAYTLARGITRRDVLISSLLARCRLADATGRALDARDDAAQALAMAVSGGYRIAEADARLVLARIHHVAGDLSAAWDELSRAEEGSLAIGYHWGSVRAQELTELFDRG